MRINCHSHIFNAKSIFTPYTLDILISRLKKLNLPEPIKALTAKELMKVFEKTGEYVQEEKLFRIMLKKLAGTDDFKQLLERLSSNNTLNIELSDPSGIESFAVEKMVNLFDRINDLFDRSAKDAKKADLIDFIHFLRISLQPSIRDVADHVMGELKKGDAIVALTMDIIKSDQNLEQFEKQLKDTSDMVLAYPGAIFPFVAVNPRRKKYLDIMERAITSMGFVGVKLYPSLGYKVDTLKMREVYKYCLEKNVPILQHCNNGGFNYRSNVNNSNPAHWDAILRDFPGLKVCFGHFGGGENFVIPGIGNDNWTRNILDLMEKYDGVYADIGYHDDPMKDEADERIYFDNLKSLLNDPRYKNRILFGTDFFMVRLRLREKNHWKWFNKRFSKGHFKRISETNPLDYLGLPKGSRKPAWNINNYIQFVRMHKEKMESSAAGWLEKAVIDQFGPSEALPKKVEFGANWDWNNKAHANCYIFLEDGQLSKHQKEKPFETIGRFKMRDLSYWAKGTGTSEIWERSILSMAEKTDTFYRANEADYQGGFTPQKAVAVLKKKYDNGALYVHELAAQCSKIYYFS